MGYGNHKPQGNRPQGGSVSYNAPNDKTLEAIVKRGEYESATITITEAERLAQHLVDTRLSSSQIRIVFSKVRQIEARWTSEDSERTDASKREIALLKPRLRYQGKRVLETQDKSPGFTVLADILIKLIDQIQTRKDFQRFVDFLEAVVAYHKFHGGRN